MTLFWTALFICSLLMQYASFVVAPAPVQAAHDIGVFELDGNADDEATAGADWAGGAEGSLDQFFVGAASESDANDVTYFHTGGSKDELDVPGWAITDTSVPDKDELLDAYAAVYEHDGDTYVFFGADRFDNDGTAQIGFWFFQDEVGIVAGDFTGQHVDGDVLILSEYTNGGVVSLICAYEWDGSGGGSNIAGAGNCDPATSGSNLNLVAAGASCDVADGTFDICAVTNDDIENAPWPFTNKDGESDFDPGQFFEGGINLSDMFGDDPPCFGTFLAETRSSAETDAQLKDFALGSLDTCVPPDITTQSSVSTADFGQQVTDTATLSGSQGPVTGSVDFFICEPDEVTAAGCPEGAGTQVGSSVTIVAGSATSSAYTVGLTSAAVGKYCWRAEYNPAADSDYLEASHTNATTECFTVAPATIDIDKVANPAGPVSAGDPIGFDVTVTNNGTGTALNVAVTDNLPAGVDWTLGAVSGDTTGVSCQINGSVGSEVLSCTDASMAGGDSFSVRVTATTDATDCGTIDNTASVTTSNDGSDSDPASVQVLCPDVQVTKTPDGGSVNAGDDITWTIKVENLGPGVAKGVVLTDNLPAGIDWSESEADCSISGAVGSEVLTCNVGDLASGASKTYQVSGATDAADCGVVNNTGSATATNEPSNVLANNSDSGSVEVLCAQIDIEKTANPVGPVNAGDTIGFDIVVSNNGAGTATGVVVTDNLPPGFDWSLGAVTGDTTGVDCQITGSVGSEVLGCTDASMASGDSFSVHVSAGTDATDCGTVNNTASVETGNDGSDEDSASVVINCPDLEVVKSGNGPLNAGEVATFTITVTNHGPGAAYDVSLTDQLPSGSWTLGGADATDCTINGSNLLTCDFGTLADDASASITVSKTTTAADCGTIHNDVTVAASNEDTATDQFPNTDDADIVVNCPDLEVVKSGNGPLNAGEVATFTITVTNHGPGAAFDVTLSDQLPAGSWTLGGADATDCTINGSNLLTCDFGTLADDASASITVSKTTTADDCGTIENEVTVAASNEDTATDQFPNTDDAAIVVNCPDVTVDKTGSGTISAGETASYTITVTNLGPGTAFDVTLSDQLPSGSWTLGGANATDCSIDGSNLLSCDFGTLTNGATRTITLSRETTAQDCGSLPNLAEVAASNEAEEDTGNNDDDHTITVLCADIVITKTADADSVSAGDPIGFTITVTNTGAGSAFGVEVNDTLPTNAGLSWTIDGGANAAECGIAAGVLSCDFGTMASGTSKTVHISSPTTAASCGTVDNTASVTTTNDGSDDDDSLVDVLCPDIVVIKSAAASPINAGDDAEFSILVWNQGEGEAKDVVLTDDLPAGVDWTLGTVSGDTDGVDCEISGSVGSEVLTCTDDSMAADDSFTVEVSGAVGAEDCGVLPNLASAEASNEAAGDTDNNSDDAAIDVLCAEIGIEKVADADEVVAGEQIGFVITVSNGGAGTAYDVEVSDVLPAGVTWTIDGAANGFSIVGGSLVFGPADMAAGASISVHIVADTDRTDCGVIDNTATVTTSNDGEDEAGDSVSVRCPEIDIDKTSDDADGIVGKGQRVTYTINVSVAEGPVTGAVLTDVLPAGQTYIGGSQTTEPASASFEVSADGRTLTWTWVQLDDIGAVVTYEVFIDDDAPIGDQVNVAEICVSEVPECESDDELVTVPDLTIVKSFTGNTGGTFESENPDNPLNGTPIAEIGDILTYTLTYDLTNGPVHNGVITDTLPVGLAYVTGSATGNAEFTFDSFDPATRTLTWTAPLVSADGSVTYQVQVLEGSAELPQPLVNVATIDSDETPPDEDERQVLVAEPPLELTPPPTLPPTSTIDHPSQGASNPGFSLMLVLLGLAGFTLVVGFITPVPERARRRDRR